MTQDELNEIIRLLNEADITKWPMEDQLAIHMAYLTMANTVAPIEHSEGDNYMVEILRKGSDDD